NTQGHVRGEAARVRGDRARAIRRRPGRGDAPAARAGKEGAASLSEYRRARRGEGPAVRGATRAARAGVERAACARAARHRARGEVVRAHVRGGARGVELAAANGAGDARGAPAPAASRPHALYANRAALRRVSAREALRLRARSRLSAIPPAHVMRYSA